jgi:hypothetical protein
VVAVSLKKALATEDLLDVLGARTEADPSEAMAAGGNRIATTGDVAAFSGVAERVFGARLPAVEAAEVGPH